MFEWFTKARRIAKLERRIDELENEVDAAYDQHQSRETALIMEIREMDQLVFRMSQCSSWDAMRPIFADLQAICAKRQKAESDRVRNLLVPELKRVYGASPNLLPRPNRKVSDL